MPTRSKDSNKFSAGSAWMGDRVIPIADASIPVTDWGLTRSDITYDVVPVRLGAFFRLDDYLDRFFVSMEKLSLNPKITKNEVKNALQNMVAVTELRDSYVSMVCSRGRSDP